MNILITSISAKIRLIRRFKQSAATYGSNVWGADVNEDIAGRFEVDSFFRQPPDTDPCFGEKLLVKCKKNRISLIVPTRDDEIHIFSALKDQFKAAGVSILAPNLQAVEICRNKQRFGEFIEKCGFLPIPVISSETLDYFTPPYFYRPVIGAGSNATGKLFDRYKANSILNNTDTLLHPFIDEEEYSIDVLLDFEGSPIQAVSRKRVLVINGESHVSKIDRIPRLEQAVLSIGKQLNLIGHNVFQAFVTKKGSFFFIEANTRIGGASDLSIEAGLDSINKILAIHFDSSSKKKYIYKEI